MSLVRCYVDLGLALFWWCRKNTNTVISVQYHAGSQCGAMSKRRVCCVHCKQTQTDLQKASWTCCISFSFAFGFLWQVTSLTHSLFRAIFKKATLHNEHTLHAFSRNTHTHTHIQWVWPFSKQWLNDCPPLTCLPVLCSPRTTSALVYQNSRHCSTLAGIEKLWMNKKQQKMLNLIKRFVVRETWSFWLLGSFECLL